ncbi:PREDICTED: uncharacterized protein LOC104605703 isoform X3 [Nelumbo nucifera]|uniref:Uncharacterized protein LOC104605703 isoform X3 n=1 Tax=Nelumbo nucifera TaxID=4432 RepID=A0A1U8AMZ1_NELNU|nr:PREDICTED: uncharacterized protein LOC104605703 isoform X3 [Nelumbo nucifera]
MDDPLVLLSCLELGYWSAWLESMDEFIFQIQPMPPKQATCDICLYKMIVKENCKHEEFVIVLAISAKVSVYQPVVIYITICVCWSNRSFTSYCYMGSSCCATNHIP